MKTSTFLYRMLISFSIIFLVLSQSFASKTTWIGPGNNWLDANSWDNGVPTMADTAIITGGTSLLDVDVLIISTAEALHVQVDAYCNLTILGSGILLVIDAPVHGIRIEENGRVINNGVINTAFTGNGIYVFGRLDNYGTISTNETGNGIVFAGSSTGINGGEFNIKNSDLGLFCTGSSKMTNTNTGEIDISNCLRGLTNSETATFTNDSLIDIRNCDITGLRNTGTFINNNKIFMLNIGVNINSSEGLVNDSTNYANGNSYVGDFENYGEIEIASVSGSAIVNDNSTNFLNTGQIYIATVFQDGFTNMPRATFISTPGSLLDITDVFMNSLDVRLGSIFEIAKTAIVEINE